LSDRGRRYASTQAADFFFVWLRRTVDDRYPEVFDDLASITVTLNARPEESRLLPNYPNPFNPETWIPFELSEDADVTVTVYDVLGQVVRRLELGQRAPGIYRTTSRAAYWDGRNSRGEDVANGTYFVELQAGDFREMRRSIMAK